MADNTRIHFADSDNKVVVGTPEQIAAQLTGTRRAEGADRFAKFDLAVEQKPLYVAVDQVIYFEADT